jgi:hypothetical protein
VKRMAMWFMNFGEDEPFYDAKDTETPTGLLKVLDSTGTRLLELGFFLGVASRMWQHVARPDKDWIPTCLEALPSCGLVLLFGWIYHLSRRCAKIELKISEMLFPRRRLPPKWPNAKDPTQVTLSVVCFFSLYMVLAWFAYNILFASFCMFVIACVDVNTRRVINNTVRKYFDNASYACRQDDEDRPVIEKRRALVGQYLFQLPHLLKEAGRAAGCLTAFGLAVGGYLHRAQWMTHLAYLVLIGTLIINEIINYLWRADRNRRWKAIEAEDKAKFDLVQVKEEPRFDK